MVSFLVYRVSKRSRITGFGNRCFWVIPTKSSKVRNAAFAFKGGNTLQGLSLGKARTTRKLDLRLSNFLVA